MHLKRQKAPKDWPIGRKGNKYLVRSSSNLQRGLPLLIVLRDVLKVAQNRKEVKKILNQEKILLNGKKINNEKNIVLLFDIITLVPAKKYYKLNLTEKGKFTLKEIKENESNYKISKIINKKVLKGKRIQINLYDGRNLISKEKSKVGDSVLINLKERKIEKILALKEKAKVIAVSGKHKGTKGIIEKIDEENKKIVLKIDNTKIEILIKQIMVIENGK